MKTAAMNEKNLKCTWNALTENDTLKKNHYFCITIYMEELSEFNIIYINVVLYKTEKYSEFKIVYDFNDIDTDLIFATDVSSYNSYDDFVLTLSRALSNKTCLRKIKKANKKAFNNEDYIRILTYKNELKDDGTVVVKE